MGRAQLVGRVAEQVDLVAVNRCDQRVPRGKVAIQGSDPDVRTASELFERYVDPALLERSRRLGEEPLAIALRIDPQRASCDHRWLLCGWTDVPGLPSC